MYFDIRAYASILTLLSPFDFLVNGVIKIYAGDVAGD
jgi:hypothetical protein